MACGTKLDNANVCLKHDTKLEKKKCLSDTRHKIRERQRLSDMKQTKQQKLGTNNDSEQKR